MRKPEPSELLFLHPITNEFWYLKLAQEQRGGAAGMIRMSGIGTFPPKEVQNDWTRASHQVLSSYTQSDTTGGGQIWEVDEATDGSRFFFATAETQYPRQVVLPRLVNEVALTGPVVLLGDYNGTFLFSANRALYRLNANGTVTSLAVTLAADPIVREGVAFQGLFASQRFFIGVTGGYQIWNGAVLSALITTSKPVDWAEWDNKLYAIQADGKLMESTDGESGTWVEKLRIDSRYTPTHLIDFVDRSDEPALHIITKSVVMSVDMANLKAYKTTQKPPRHPNSALGATTFNMDLFISYGLGVDQYTGQSKIPMGLDRDFGMPQAYKGKIIGLADGYNGIYALVQGVFSVDAGGHPSFMSDASRHAVTLPPSGTPSAIMIWNVNGWHTIWTSGTDGRTPTNLLFSNSNDTFRLVWGLGGSIMFIDIPTEFFNPIHRGANWKFDDEGYIEYGRLDFAMVGTPKILTSIEVRTKDVTATETIEIQYALDDEIWRTLGTIAAQPTNGMTKLQLGLNGTYPDSVTPRYDGVASSGIRIKAILRRGSDATKSPILESVGVVFHKLMGALNGYEFTIDCTNNNGYKNRTNADIQRFLQEMIDSKALIPFWHQGRWRPVRMSGVSGEDETGTDIKGDRSVALLEVIEPNA